MDVGVRELKQNLSKYLDRVAEGETVVVTDRGTPKALIVPIPDTSGLERGIDEGWIRPPKRVGLSSGAPFRSDRRIDDLLSEDRAERF